MSRMVKAHIKNAPQINFINSRSSGKPEIAPDPTIDIKILGMRKILVVFVLAYLILKIEFWHGSTLLSGFLAYN